MELWDIYDSEKRLTGRTMQRNDWTMQEGDYHLTALGILERSDGTILITRRSADKAWAPGHWEVSGGAVQAGEDSYSAALREVLEETGIDAADCHYEFILSYRRESPGDNYFVDVYKFYLDFDESELHLQTTETDGFRLVTKEEIRALGEAGLFLHYNSIKEALS